MIARTTTPLTEAALHHAAGGLSIVPIGANKKAIGEWKIRQTTGATDAEIRTAMSDRRAVGFAVVAGEVSGGLEIIDFDVPGYFERWRDAVDPDLLQRLPVQRTGGGGWQVAYRRPTPGRNAKLAHEPTDDPANLDGRVVAIETRGEGGYACLPPSRHPSGGTYCYTTVETFADAPRITDEQAEAMLDAARALCKVPMTKRQIEAEKEAERIRQNPKPVRKQNNDKPSVIGAWNAAVPIRDMLKRAGYTPDPGSDQYTRPGEGASPGGVVIFDDTGRSYHHSTNDPMRGDGKHAVDSFDVFREFEHGGNYSEAVKSAAMELGMTTTRKSATERAAEDEAVLASIGAGFGDTANAVAGAKALLNGSEPHIAPPSPATAPSPPASPPPTRRPAIGLPCDTITFAESAEALGDLLGKSGHYSRGRRFARVRGREIELLTPNQARSIFEIHANLYVQKLAADGSVTMAPKRCSETNAAGIVAADPFIDALPPINSVTHCPVLLPSGDIASGYHAETGIYAMGEVPDDVTFDDAVPMLLGLLDDFAFVTEADKSRAAVAMLTPAMIYGGLLGPAKRCPATVYEADQSQSGKGYKTRLDAAIYGTNPTTVSQRKSGVGGIEESVGRALIAGSPLVALDNLRGRVDVPWLESALTEPTVDARTPYSKSMSVDPSRTAWTLTSNSAELTPDLANRCSIVRITKHPDDYAYRGYPEGDLIDHVTANQTRYLGAVYAVLRKWLDQGRPGEPDGRHDMRAWAGAVVWIVRELLRLPDPLDGHRELQRRTANQSANWLRDVCLAVAASGDLDRELHARDLLDILVDAEIEVPGIKRHDDPECDGVRGNALRAIGRRLSGLFKKQAVGDTIEVDNFTIYRRVSVSLEDSSKFDKSYEFSRE